MPHCWKSHIAAHMFIGTFSLNDLCRLRFRLIGIMTMCHSGSFAFISQASSSFKLNGWPVIALWGWVKCEARTITYSWFKLYFIRIIYDKYTSNTVYDYNTITIQMGFRRKSNDLFESVSQEFTLLVYVLSCRNCYLCRE